MKKAENKKTPRKVLVIAGTVLAAAIAVAVILLTLGNAGGTTDGKNAKYYAKMSVENYGEIVLELDGDVAPITVNNFVRLVNEGFYDGLTFHRIISGFMIQGGDPNGNGTGGSSEKIKGEFSVNGVTNNLKHTRGVISMARSSDPNSASSQFFIMHQDASHLDGSYAAFGKVLRGMETVDAICEQVPVTDGNGTVLKENQPVITAVRIISENEATGK